MYKVLGVMVILALVPACSGSSQATDGGDDGGTDGGVIHWGECPFDYTAPGSVELEDEMGMERTVSDMHLRCRVDFDQVQAEVLVKAVGVEIKSQAVIYEVSLAQVCREGSVETLPVGQADFGKIGRHSWKSMDVAFDGRMYSFYMGEMCVGARPCSPWPDTFDVHTHPGMELVAEGVSTLCAGVGERGIPAPLVAQVRLPPEGDGIPFTMGNADGDPDEAPVHTFDIYSNRLDVREATNDDFARFLSDHGNDCDGHPCVDTSGEGFGLEERDGFWKPQEGAEQLPVVHVSWYGANEYCSWRRLILPYESNWEMAASAMGERSYPWGEAAPDCDLVLYDACAANGPEQVCARAAGDSREGICNLAGNVSEWIGDYYLADHYATCEENQTCQRGPWVTESGEHVIRGGSFALPAHNLRATDRNFAAPETTAADLGVRCMASNPSF